MTVAIVLLALLGSAWLLAVIEGWTTTGRLRPATPLLTGLAHLGRESLVPRKPDRLFFETAPVLLVATTAAIVAGGKPIRTHTNGIIGIEFAYSHRSKGPVANHSMAIVTMSAVITSMIVGFHEAFMNDLLFWPGVKTGTWPAPGSPESRR